MERKLAALSSRRDTLKEMAEDYKDFIPGVKEVLIAKKRAVLSGICGVVAELLHVPKHLEVAIETVLENSIQQVIVEKEENAWEAITHLKKYQHGRAAFIPLDRICGVSIPESDQRSMSSLKGFVGVAIDLVSFDAEYYEAFSFLLGNLIVAETLEVAISIAEKLEHRYRVVTIQGDSINHEGLITGGSMHKRAPMLLSRQRLITELDQDIRNAELEIAKLKIGKQNSS